MVDTSISLAKTADTPALHQQVVSAIELALRTIRPRYVSWGRAPLLRLTNATDTRPGVTLHFAYRGGHREHHDVLLLTEITLVERQFDRRLFGLPRTWDEEFEHTLRKAVLMSDDCVELLNKMKTDEDTQRADAEKLDDEIALRRLIEALGKL